MLFLAERERLSTMLTHKQIWRGIDMLAQKNQLSASGLAKRAGLDPTTFNKSKRITKQGKPRWPSTESLSKILDATQTGMADFVTLLDEGPGGNGRGPSRRLRCVRLSQAEREEAFDASGFPQSGGPWEDIELPAFAESGLYAIELDRDVAPPMLRSGDVIVVSPESSVRRHDRVAVRLKSGEVEFGIFQRRTAQRLSLGSFTAAAEDRQLPVADIAWQARIVCLCAQQ
jgi:phage repressor protein C with HTH and peptisase S24 domain